MLDREQQEEHLLLIKATEDCETVPDNEIMFDEADDTLLQVIIKVDDINDNAPQFINKVFTGGVTTDADFGTQFMHVKVILYYKIYIIKSSTSFQIGKLLYVLHIIIPINGS